MHFLKNPCAVALTLLVFFGNGYALSRHQTSRALPAARAVRMPALARQHEIVLQKALAAIFAKDFEGAATVIEKHRQSTAGLTYLDAWQLTKQKKYQAALDTLKKLDYARTRYGRALTLLEIYNYSMLEKYKTAAELLSRVSLESEAEKLVFAWVKYKLGDYDAADAMFKKIATQSENPAAWFQLGEIAYRDTRYADAREWYRKVIAREDELLGAWALYRTGLIMLKTGSVSDGRDLLASLQRSNPAAAVAPYALISLADSYREKDPARYQVVLGHLIAQYPKHEFITRVSLKLAISLFQTGDYHTAQRYFKYYIEHQGTELRFARYWLANTQFAAGDFSQARALFSTLESGEDIWAELSKLRVADLYLIAGDTSPAKTMYRKLISASRYGNIRASAYASMGWLYFKENKFQEAIRYFERARERAARTKEFRLTNTMRIGDCYFNLNQFEQARAAYQEVHTWYVSRGRFKKEATYKLGMTAYRLGEFEAARGLWNTVIKKTGDAYYQANALYWIGFSYFRAAAYEQTVAVMNDLAEKYPNTHIVPDAIVRQGDAYFNMGEYQSAADIYTMFIERYPTHNLVQEALYGAQWSYRKLGADEKAREIAENFVAQFPDSAYSDEIEYRIAENYYLQGDLKSARQRFRDFLQKHEASELIPQARYLLIVLEFKLGEYRAVVKQYHILKQNWPKNIFSGKAVFYAAGAHFHMKDYDRAARRYQQFINEQPGDVLYGDALYNVALSYQRAKNYAQAIEWFERFARKFPDQAVEKKTRLKIAFAYMDLKKFDRAEATLQAIVRENKKAYGAEAQYWLADMQKNQKEYLKAAHSYIYLSNRYSGYGMWSATALANAAEMYEKLKKYDAALKVYNRIINEASDPRYKETARKRYNALKEALGK